MIGVLRPRKSAMNCSSLTSSGSTPPGSKPPDSDKMNAELAKHPRIDKPQFAPRSQLRDQVRVLGDLRRRFRKPPCARSCPDGRSTARSAERRGLPVWPRTARLPFFFGCDFSLQIEHNVLARTVHAHDPLAFKRRRDDASRRFKRLLSRTDPHRFDCVSGNALVEAARNGFDFGKFGHAVRIQDRC